MTALRAGSCKVPGRPTDAPTTRRAFELAIRSANAGTANATRSPRPTGESTSGLPSRYREDMSDSFLWGIHGGKTSDADALFKNQKVIALGWAGTPDLSTLPDDREAFKDMYRATFPDKSDGNVISSASQLYRFVHEMQEGDLVAYPSRPDRRVYLGRVTGPTSSSRAPRTATATSEPSLGSRTYPGPASRRAPSTKWGPPRPYSRSRTTPTNTSPSSKASKAPPATPPTRLSVSSQTRSASPPATTS